jgi:hypothetical protein
MALCFYLRMLPRLSAISAALLLGGLMLPVGAADNHVCKDYDADFPYSQVECNFACLSGDFISVWVVSDDDDADVYGRATCGPIVATCSGEGYECDHQNPTPVPGGIVAYAGDCWGFASEVIPSALFIQCAAGAEWSSAAGGQRSTITIQLQDGVLSARACDFVGGPAPTCAIVPAACTAADHEGVTGLRCGTL